MIHNGHTHHADAGPGRKDPRIALVALSTALLCGSVALPAFAAAAPPGHATAAPGVAAAPSGPRAPLPASLTDQRLTWRTCPAPTPLQAPDARAPGALPDGTPWECATLKVPLDYAHPDGETIGLALIRAKARPKDGQKRIGSLVFNFGGPGASGVAGLPSFAEGDKQLHARYDLVSFDPRGVGASAPVRCLGDKDTDALTQFDGTPDDAKELQALTALSEKYLSACEKNSGKVLAHVGTTDSARDMDLLRHVLGDDKLNYFGMSYGTQLGGVYAHLFPRNVGRTVFDAVMDPTQDVAQGALAQAKGFQLALDNYLKDCGKRPDCPAGGSVEQGRKRISDLLDRLDAHPLPTQDGRKLTKALATTGLISALYSKDLWPYLTQALQEIEQHRTGNVLVALADFYSERAPSGHYSNLDDAFTAISCADRVQRYTEKDVEAMLPKFRAASPVFGEDMAAGLTACTGWPVKGESRDPDVSAEGASPILLVGNTGDPATPYAGTRHMAEELGEGVGVQLTYTGQGHGSYGDDDCVTDAVNTYLLDGTVPRDRAVCD
ncbi:alpha/beta hydrolase [Streptomyces sp. NPDC046727]|uniref:alpha/beta hydrolase n=1 Tax=Streptomyces sp. NPDC046727 TaxID=3155373 RepID=UPI0033DB9C17